MAVPPWRYGAGMTNAPIVAVRGEASREVEPDLATFSVTVHARDRDRAATLSRLAARVEEVRAVLDGYAAAIEKRETSRMSVSAESKPSSEKVIAYVGQATTSVVVADLEVVGEMMLRVADQDQVSVDGPYWSVRPGSPIYRAMREAAIGDAISRAREYAHALGARVTGLLELTDNGMSGSAPVRLAALRWAPGRRAGRDEPPPELDLDPQLQQIHAEVEARFEISEPAALAEPLD